MSCIVVLFVIYSRYCLPLSLSRTLSWSLVQILNLVNIILSTTNSAHRGSMSFTIVVLSDSIIKIIVPVLCWKKRICIVFITVIKHQ